MRKRITIVSVLSVNTSSQLQVMSPDHKSESHPQHIPCMGYDVPVAIKIPCENIGIGRLDVVLRRPHNVPPSLLPFYGTTSSRPSPLSSCPHPSPSLAPPLPPSLRCRWRRGRLETEPPSPSYVSTFSSCCCCRCRPRQALLLDPAPPLPADLVFVRHRWPPAAAAGAVFASWSFCFFQGLAP